MRVTQSRSVLAWLFLVAVSATVQAQESKSTPASDGQRAAARELSDKSIRQPEARTALTSPQPQFTLTAEKGKQSVAGTIGVKVDRVSFDVGVSGPIGETDDVASPLTLGGLGTGATISFGLTSTPGIKRRLSADDINRLDDICTDAGASNDCDIEDLKGELLARYSRVLLPTVPFYFGLHFKGSRTKFVFTEDKGATDSKPVFEPGQAVVASVGLLTPGLWFLAAHLEHQASHEPGSPAKQVCVAEGNISTCRTTRFGKPTPKTTDLLTLEGRRIYAGHGLALNPNLVIDLVDDQQIFDVPIYFLREQKADSEISSALNGGISVGWHSSEGIFARALIGVSFDLIKIR